MGTSFPYWEGPISFAGSHRGVGYLELTGFQNQTSAGMGTGNYSPSVGSPGGNYQQNWLVIQTDHANLGP